MANYALAEDNTRGKKSIKIPLATKDVYKYCPENYAAYIYNKLPERYKNNTYSILKKNVKMFFLERAFYNIDEFLSCQ